MSGAHEPRGERAVWLKSLKVGDVVGMHDGHRTGERPPLYRVVVVGFTPGGRINVSTEVGASRFQLWPNGYLCCKRGATYADRHIEPLKDATP